MSNENKTIMTSSEYINSMHRLGRIGNVIMIVIMLALPTIAGIYFDAMPKFSQVMAGALGLLAIFVPAALGEVISYTPILGSSIYLCLITGNVTNQKIPSVNNALNLLDVGQGTEEADIVSSIAVCISTFTTLAIIFVGVLLLVPLQPVLQTAAVKTATGYISPALFGSLLLANLNNNLGGGVQAPGRLKAMVPLAVLVAAIVLLDKFVLHMNIMVFYQGFVIIAMIIVGYFVTKYLYNKGQIKVILPGESE